MDEKLTREQQARIIEAFPNAMKGTGIDGKSWQYSPSAGKGLAGGFLLKVAKNNNIDDGELSKIYENIKKELKQIGVVDSEIIHGLDDQGRIIILLEHFKKEDVTKIEKKAADNIKETREKTPEYKEWKEVVDPLNEVASPHGKQWVASKDSKGNAIIKLDIELSPYEQKFQRAAYLLALKPLSEEGIPVSYDKDERAIIIKPNNADDKKKFTEAIRKVGDKIKDNMKILPDLDNSRGGITIDNGTSLAKAYQEADVAAQAIVSAMQSADNQKNVVMAQPKPAPRAIG